MNQIIPSEKPKSPTERLIEQFLMERRVRGLSTSERTKESYGGTVRDFLDYVKGVPLTAIRHADIRDYLSWLLTQGNSESSVNQKTCALRAFFNFLEITGTVPTSPARLIKQRKVPKRLVKALSIEEVDRLIAAAQAPVETAVLETLYASGMRVSELKNLRIENLDFQIPAARVIGKGNRERIVPLNHRAVEAIQVLTGERTAGPVFTLHRRPNGNGLRLELYNGHRYWRFVWWERRRGESGESFRVSRGKHLGPSTLTYEEAEARAEKFARERLCRDLPKRVDRPFSKEGIEALVRRVGARAGLKVHPHMLRHCFASHLHNGGADLVAIKELMGHESIATTQIYTHVAPAKLLETWRKFHPHGDGQ